MEILTKERDYKGLYSLALNEGTKNVVGVDISFPEPECPDMIVDNSESRGLLSDVASEIFSKVENQLF